MTARWPASIFALALAVGGLASCGRTKGLSVGSKKFTESVILGEVLTLLAASTLEKEAEGEVVVEARHRRELGGTRILWNALLGGEIDVYPEYTGTIAEEILGGRVTADGNALRAELAERDVRMTAPLGFNNTYALGMRSERAAELGIRTISDLVKHPALRYGFTSEFMNRKDGWPSLRHAYGLQPENVVGLDHDIAYRGLESGAIDVMDLYSTDAEIEYYNLTVLADDRNHFPRYDAVVLYRADLEQRFPGVVSAIHRLEGQLDAAGMTRMNTRVKVHRVSEAQVAAGFLLEALRVRVRPAVRENMIVAVHRRTVEHLWLVVPSMLAALAVALPLGVLAARKERLAPYILGTVGVLQTIPALALLVLIMPVFEGLDLPSLGRPPAILALFLYSLLPVVRNTCTGLRSMAPPLRESAGALGLTPRAVLFRVELPLASPTILAGIKTAAVMNVGFATLGALIGADGYGQPILTGIRLDDMGLILRGAIPAAALALIVQGLFSLSERVVVPRGLRLPPEE